MNKWGFIGQDSFVGISKSATSFKFKSKRGYVRDERLAFSNPHSSYSKRYRQYKKRGANEL